MAQAMLDRVIHTTDNLDEKVGRIFTSMSFLTVGATILFTSFLTNGLLFRVGGIGVVTLLFLGFIISVAVATAYMLQAMGPRFRFGPWGSQSKAAQSLNPSPTGYADKIASMDQKQWADFLGTVSLSELYDKWLAESLEEVHTLSRKVDRKAGEMRRAQQAFVIAIIFLILMVVLAVYPRL